MISPTQLASWWLSNGRWKPWTRVDDSGIAPENSLRSEGGATRRRLAVARGTAKGRWASRGSQVRAVLQKTVTSRSRCRAPAAVARRTVAN